MHEVRVAEVGASEVRPAEVWHRPGIQLSPLIPYLDPFF
jgi:hypothetical protein